LRLAGPENQAGSGTQTMFSRPDRADRSSNHPVASLHDYAVARAALNEAIGQPHAPARPNGSGPRREILANNTSSAPRMVLIRPCERISVSFARKMVVKTKNNGGPRIYSVLLSVDPSQSGYPAIGTSSVSEDSRRERPRNSDCCLRGSPEHLRNPETPAVRAFRAGYQRPMLASPA